MTTAETLTFRKFSSLADISLETQCRDFFRSHRERIRIKKEPVAVKNLSAIVEAALSLSSSGGFDTMSLRELTRESGLSMGALYSYFSSKEELLEIIQIMGQRQVKILLEEWIQKETDPGKRLRLFIRVHLYLSELMQQWFYFFFMETRNFKPRQRTIPLESELMTETICIDIMKEGVDRKVFTIDNITLAGSSVKALLQDWYLKRWKYRTRKITVDAYADFVIAMIESYIMPE